MYGCLCTISCSECLFCWLMVMVASVCIVVCVYMTTPTGCSGCSLFWQRMPLSRLALTVNRNVQYSAVILHSAVAALHNIGLFLLLNAYSYITDKRAFRQSQETQLSLRDRATRACQLKSGKVLHKCRRLVFEKV